MPAQDHRTFRTSKKPRLNPQPTPPPAKLALLNSPRKKQDPVKLKHSPINSSNMPDQKTSNLLPPFRFISPTHPVFSDDARTPAAKPLNRATQLQIPAPRSSDESPSPTTHRPWSRQPPFVKSPRGEGIGEPGALSPGSVHRAILIVGWDFHGELSSRPLSIHPSSFAQGMPQLCSEPRC